MAKRTKKSILALIELLKLLFKIPKMVIVLIIITLTIIAFWFCSIYLITPHFLIIILCGL
jgi:hypothetical protein